MQYLTFLSRLVDAVALFLDVQLSLSTVAVLFVFINGGLLFFNDVESDSNEAVFSMRMIQCHALGNCVCSCANMEK